MEGSCPLDVARRDMGRGGSIRIGHRPLHLVTAKDRTKCKNKILAAAADLANSGPGQVSSAEAWWRVQRRYLELCLWGSSQRQASMGQVNLVAAGDTGQVNEQRTWRKRT
ncbi:hypothetical protein AMTR_s00093p00062040 [Amborella trichopoda]|uniref:Uncharacterized protein n=1 Tax=Amborella trichopoda TaxID=13333 RepID=W1NU57_AMBTC|nr:hypothetical protein AMTR_s00093p00062040 [Amborella trichopoda]